MQDAFWHIPPEGYEVHRQVWHFFADGPDRRRDFLYRSENDRGRPSFFVVSKRAPHDDLDIWTIKAKPYHPRIASGDRLAFSTRVNPVRTKKNANGKGHHRHDVVMEAKNRLKARGIPRQEWPLITEIVQREGEAWLESRVERNGFSLEPNQIRVDGYQQHTFHKKRGKHEIHLSSFDITGRLTVTDKDRFIQTLYQGIGPAKGFGFGLLMVRRI